MISKTSFEHPLFSAFANALQLQVTVQKKDFFASSGMIKWKVGSKKMHVSLRYAFGGKHFRFSMSGGKNSRNLDYGNLDQARKLN